MKTLQATIVRRVTRIEKLTIDFDSRTETVEIYNIDDFPYDMFKDSEIVSSKRCSYLNVPAAFDIETTTVEDKFQKYHDDKKHYIGFMYVWQFCICDKVCFGRTWEEFQEFLDRLAEKLLLHTSKRLVIYVHYLAFEFQFMRNFIDVENVFARKKRVPLKIQANNSFEFRCSYFLSNMSLDKFIKNTPNAKFNKQSGDDFDYKKVRLPNTPLSDLEKSYCYCDVRGLCEAIQHLLEEDTIATIPLTSTGFLRRDVRKAVLSNDENRKEIDRCKLTPKLYVLCKTAARGGNTHANAIYSNIIVDDSRSKDRKSSYPAEMIVDNYPITAFRNIRPTKDNFDNIVETKAVLMDITLYNVSLKHIAVIPYIALAKTTRCKQPRCDNGRIASAVELSMVCTDVDWKIIRSQYEFSDIEIKEIWFAEYGKLNNEFRNLLMEFFLQKELLNPDKNPNADKYIYAKFKNKINAFFGMMLTDICNPEIMYDPSADETWTKGEIDLDYMLNKHYKSRSTFLTYQHGVWVTANARKRLQEPLDLIGDDAMYVDTDSVKYVGDHEEEFKLVNENWLAECENNDIKPYVEVYGKKIYLGTWEDDGKYLEFTTMGAKKYAYTSVCETEKEKKESGYTMRGGDTIGFHITVAGLAKEKGAKFLVDKANKEGKEPIELFKRNTVVPKGSSGRTVAYYNDEKEPREIEINGTKIIVGSNIAVVDASYTFGISDDYYDYLCSIDPLMFEDEKEIKYEED